VHSNDDACSHPLVRPSNTLLWGIVKLNDYKKNVVIDKSTLSGGQSILGYDEKSDEAKLLESLNIEETTHILSNFDNVNNPLPLEKKVVVPARYPAVVDKACLKRVEEVIGKMTEALKKKDGFSQADFENLQDEIATVMKMGNQQLLIERNGTKGAVSAMKCNT
jgi:hypothetical protein